jgi:phosphatidylserine decarboxylase
MILLKVLLNFSDMARQSSVESLIHLLASNPHLKKELVTSLHKAQQPGITTLDEFYNYINKLLTHIPTDEELMPSVREFYYVLGKSPVLKKDEKFNSWIKEFSTERGIFLDTPESAKCLETFAKNSEYKIDDYMITPSGWLTYNQFLGRQVKPGRRPVAGLCDDNVVVSPADGVFMGQWTIEKNSTITAKGETYSVSDLLNGSTYKNAFEQGIFTHTFLSITDYHWYHMPVRGIIKEIKKISGIMWVNEEKKSDGKVENTDDAGFQFTHTRGSVIIESPIGLVAVLPIGMGHISSINFCVDEGATLGKGNALGYFAFGGSDIIMLFQHDKINFSGKKNTHYKQGEQIAVAK